MDRIVNPNEPFSFLEQRLHYAESLPARKWLNLVENVPQWPIPKEPEGSLIKKENSFDYQNCTGNSDLKKAISERELARYGLMVDEGNILITNGGLHGLSLIFRSLAVTNTPSERKLVLCQAPVLTSIAKMLEASGYSIQLFSCEATGSNFSETFRSVSDKVTAVFINSPNNPTGVVMKKALLEEILNTCSERSLDLVADLVYDSFIFEEIVHENPLCLNDNWNNVYVVNSCSKNYGMPGLRIGWVLSSAGNVKKLGGVLERECVSVSGVTQELATKAIERGNQSLFESVNERRGFLIKKLRAETDISFITPQGGTQILVKVPVNDIEEFADYLMLKHGLILATTQNFYGLSGSYIRLPIGCPNTRLRDAISMLTTGLWEYRKLLGNRDTIRNSKYSAVA